MAEKLRISYSKANTFLNCRMAYHWHYVEGLSPKVKAAPLQIGDIVHQLLNLHDKGKLTIDKITNLQEFVQELYPDNTDELSQAITAEAARLVGGYLKAHPKGKEELKLIPGETGLIIERPTFYLYGRVDVWARDGKKRLWRGERKTTARLDSFFLGGLKSGLQGGVYDILSEAVLNEKLQGTFYDLLVKTNVPQFPRTFVPRSATRIERTWATIEGVVRDIERGDFYPSSRCFSYNRECDYRILCEKDSKMTREAFYDVVEETKEEEEGGKDNGSD